MDGGVPAFDVRRWHRQFWQAQLQDVLRDLNNPEPGPEEVWASLYGQARGNVQGDPTGLEAMFGGGGRGARTKASPQDRSGESTSDAGKALLAAASKDVSYQLHCAGCDSLVDKLVADKEGCERSGCTFEVKRCYAEDNAFGGKTCTCDISCDGSNGGCYGASTAGVADCVGLIRRALDDLVLPPSPVGLGLLKTDLEGTAAGEAIAEGGASWGGWGLLAAAAVVAGAYGWNRWGGGGGPRTGESEGNCDTNWPDKSPCWEVPDYWVYPDADSAARAVYGSLYSKLEWSEPCEKYICEDCTHWTVKLNRKQDNRGGGRSVGCCECCNTNGATSWLEQRCGGYGAEGGSGSSWW